VGAGWWGRAGRGEVLVEGAGGGGLVEVRGWSRGLVGAGCCNINS
jgi:hypothetical protein